MNIIEKIANLISPPPVNPNIKIADEAFKLSPGLAPSPAELDKIRKIAAEYRNVIEMETGLTEAALYDKFLAMQKEHRDATRSGELATIKVEGLATLRSEFEMKRQFAREQMRLIQEEASAHAKPLYKRTLSAVQTFAANRKNYEMEQCESFGLSFSPSPVLQAIGALASNLETRLRLDSFGGQAPGIYFFLNLEA